jgi:hypothetical protein
METQAPITRAVVVCESMFGNTRAVGEAIARSLEARFDRVDVLDVADAPSRFDDVSLLVVGAPTHAFGMSRPSTRRAAGEQGAGIDAAAGRGVREWLATLDRPAGTVRAAVFDTRVRTPPVPGSAARAVRRGLRRLGFDVVAHVSFAVAGTPGPLADHELDRAAQWAAALDVLARPTVGTP